MTAGASCSILLMVPAAQHSLVDAQARLRYWCQGVLGCCQPAPRGGVPPTTHLPRTCVPVPYRGASVTVVPNAPSAIVTLTGPFTSTPVGTVVTLVVGARSAEHELPAGGLGAPPTVTMSEVGELTLTAVTSRGHPELPYVTTAS